MRAQRLVLLLFTTASLLTACANTQPGIQIDEAWARPGQTGENSAVYFQMTSFEIDDALLRAHTSAAMKTELHRSVMNQDGTMSMEQQEQIALFNSETVALEPGDFHVMLMGLTRDLSPGDELILTLDFQHHGELTINVPIQNP